MRDRRLQLALTAAVVLGIASVGLAADATAKKAAAAPKADAGRYDVLLQFHLPTFADAMVAKIDEGLGKEMANKKSGESDEDFAIRKLMAQNIREGLTRAIKQLDDVRLGWRLDRQSKRTYLDFSATAQAGSQLAQRFAEVKELKTAFAGFQLPGAALKANWVGLVPADESAASVKVIKLVRAKELKKIDQEATSDDDKRIRKDLAEKLLDVIEETVAAGRSDGGLSLVVQPKAVTLIAGGYVADGAKLEEVVKPVATFLQGNHPLFSTLKLDADKCEGVNLHTLSLPIPAVGEGEKAIQAVGESLEIVVGFGKQAVYVATGRDAMKCLKQAIQKSATPAVPAAPFEVSLALQPVADFLAVMGREQDRSHAQAAAGLLKAAPGKDHLKITAKPIERGMILRAELEQGVLDLIGAINPQAKQFLQGK